MVFIYNYLMLGLLCVFFPIWISLVILRRKHRRTFLERLFMKAIAMEGSGLSRHGNEKWIWIHALSVGEVLSAEPLVIALSRKHGPGRLIFTTSTHTGFQMAMRVIASRVHALRYFPYDTLFSINRALEIIRPCQVVIVETDIWPNFLDRLSKRRIPVYLVNARLSNRSYRGYLRVAFFMGRLLSVFDRICVQTDMDRQRFRALGVPETRLVTVGNIKFDQTPVSISADDLNRLAKQFKISADTHVWVAGSTHEGEEVVLSKAYHSVRESGIDLVLIVAPRDPGRAVAVRKIFEGANIDAVTMEQIARQPGPSSVVVIDRIGILRSVYALADVAFVGGSLVNAAGHNPLEPASVAKPILLGPYTDDFRWICQTLESAGGAIRVSDALHLAARVRELLLDKSKNEEMGQCAHSVFHDNRGAVARTMAVIDNMAEI